MAWLIKLRWVLLGLAFLCALTWAGAYALPYGVKQMLPISVALYGAAPLQALGVFGMSRHLGARGGLAIGMGYGAALLWVVALVGSALGAQAGAGGLVYGILIVLPAIGLAGLLQAIAILLFALKPRA